jgi:hypothetical protein
MRATWILVAAGGQDQPGLPAAILHDRRPPRLAGAGVAVGRAQRAEDMADAALADADQAGQVGEGEPLAALQLP